MRWGRNVFAETCLMRQLDILPHVIGFIIMYTEHINIQWRHNGLPWRVGVSNHVMSFVVYFVFDFKEYKFTTISMKPNVQRQW